MVRKQPPREAIGTSEARQNWSKLLNRVHSGKARVVVEKDGIAVAGIVSAADLDRLAFLEDERARNFAVIDELREAFRDVPDEEIEAEIERALKLVREELTAERKSTRR
jgi:prevent-host-death family protein